jgi:hypothetical protein
VQLESRTSLFMRLLHRPDDASGMQSAADAMHCNSENFILYVLLTCLNGAFSSILDLADHILFAPCRRGLQGGSTGRGTPPAQNMQQQQPGSMNGVPVPGPPGAIHPRAPPHQMPGPPFLPGPPQRPPPPGGLRPPGAPGPQRGPPQYGRPHGGPMGMPPPGYGMPPPFGMHPMGMPPPGMRPPGVSSAVTSLYPTPVTCIR